MLLGIDFPNMFPSISGDAEQSKHKEAQGSPGFSQ